MESTSHTCAHTAGEMTESDHVNRKSQESTGEVRLIESSEKIQQSKLRARQPLNHWAGVHWHSFQLEPSPKRQTCLSTCDCFENMLTTFYWFCLKWNGRVCNVRCAQCGDKRPFKWDSLFTPTHRRHSRVGCPAEIRRLCVFGRPYAHLSSPLRAVQSTNQQQ